MTRYTHGVGHDGKSNAFAKPGEPVLAVHHDPNAARAQDHLHGDNSIARRGAPKRFHPVATHNGMHRTTGTNIGAPTVTTLSAIPDASNPCALDPTKAGKAFIGKPVAASPGMRSRTSPKGLLNSGPPGHEHRVLAKYSNELTAARHAIGRAVLDEAFSSAAPDDRAAHGRNNK